MQTAGAKKKSSVGWKRIVGSIPYEKLCLWLFDAAHSRL
jgi:hypothetical protein